MGMGPMSMWSKWSHGCVQCLWVNQLLVSVGLSHGVGANMDAWVRSVGSLRSHGCDLCGQCRTVTQSAPWVWLYQEGGWTYNKGKNK